jgi:hypothetical protein
MKKRLLVLLFISAWIISSNAQSLIVNGNFEAWQAKSRFPAEWDGSKRKSVFKKSADAHSGKNALQIIFTPQKKNENVRINTAAPLSLEKGEYTASIFLKGTGDVRYFCLTQKDAVTGSKPSKGNLTGTPKIGAVNTGKWKEYKLAFTVHEANEYIVYISFNSGSEETPFLVDDISLKKK